MYLRRCCVPGCDTQNKAGVKKHSFPDPIRHMKRFEAWVQAIGGDILQLDPLYIWLNRRVCHRHFSKRDIYTSNRLSKQAVPVLFVPHNSTSGQKDCNEVPKTVFNDKCQVPNPTNGEPDSNELAPTKLYSGDKFKDKFSCEPPLKECYVYLTRFRACDLPSGHPDVSKLIPQTQRSSAGPKLQECYVSLERLKGLDNTECPALKDASNAEVESDLTHRDTAEKVNRKVYSVLSWFQKPWRGELSKRKRANKKPYRSICAPRHSHSDHTYCVQQKDEKGDYNVKDDNETVHSSKARTLPIDYVNKYLKGEPIAASVERRLELLREDHTYSNKYITSGVPKADADVVRNHFKYSKRLAAKKSIVLAESESDDHFNDADYTSDDSTADNKDGIAHDDNDVEMCEEPQEVKACRLCLTLDGELRDLDDGLREACSNLGVDMVAANRPDNICVMCIAQVTKACVFKSQCARAHDALTRAISDREEVRGKDEQGGVTWQSAVLSINRHDLNFGRILSTSDVVHVNIYPDPEHVNKLDANEVEDLKEFADESRDSVLNVEDSASVKDADEDDEDENNDKSVIPEDAINDFNENREENTGVVPEDIDLNDVFKGLEDNAASELESLSDADDKENCFAHVRTRLKSNRKKGFDWIIKTSAALSSCRVRVLSELDQMRHHKRRVESTASTEEACRLCPKIFDNPYDLKYHIYFVHQKRRGLNENVCKFCFINFDSEYDLHEHCMMLHWYEFDCNYCTEPHITLQSLLECYDDNIAHAPHRVGDAPVKQNDKSFKSHFEIRPQTKEEVYNQQVHSQLNSKYFCDVCKKGFLQYGTLKSHLLLHEPFGGNSYQCEYCNIHFLTKKGLVHHIILAHMYSYTCLYCDEVLYSWSTARSHYSSIHQPLVDMMNGDSYQCRICNANFSTKSQYISHKRTHICHCSVCGRVASNLEALYKHQLIYHTHIRPCVRELNDPSARCAECDLYFASVSVLKVHLSKYHSRQCVRCGTKFRSRNDMRVHVENCENGKQNVSGNCHVEEATKEAKKDDLKLYLCSICGKTISSSKHAHIRRHKSEPLCCKFCKVRHRDATSLIRHMIRFHTHKPFICKVCNSRYGTRALCKAHILKIHVPELLYSCQWCPRRFAYKDYLTVHVRNEHKEQAADFALNYNREQGKLYTYPHMLTDVTLLPAELVTDLTLYVSDYTGTNFTQLSDAEKDQYLYVDHSIDPNVPTISEETYHNMIQKLARKRHNASRYRTFAKRSKIEKDDSNAAMKETTEMMTVNSIEGHVDEVVNQEPGTKEPSYEFTNDAFHNIIKDCTEGTETTLECDNANPVTAADYTDDITETANECGIANSANAANFYTDNTEHMEEVITEENAQVTIESDTECSGQFIEYKPEHAKESAHQESETFHYNITEDEVDNADAINEEANDVEHKDSNLVPVKKYRVEIVRREDVFTKKPNVDEKSEFINEYGDVQQQNIVQYMETGEQKILESTQSNVEESVAVEYEEEPVLEVHRKLDKDNAEDTTVDEQMYELPTEEKVENELLGTDNKQASNLAQEDTVMGQLIEHEGKNYVLVDGQWYELNF